MRSNNVLGFIFAATLDDKIPELASSRTTASVPIGGKYRIIDFDLSNMSNSGISNVGIVAKSNFQSLMDHVGSGSAYDLSKRRSNLSILPPYDGKAFSSFVEPTKNTWSASSTASASASTAAGSTLPRAVSSSFKTVVYVFLYSSL